MNLDQLKRELRDEKKRHRKLDSAINRAQRLKKWSPFGFLDRRLDASIDKARTEKAQAADRIAVLEDRIRHYTPDVPPVVDGGWHPGAKRVQVSAGIGAPINVPPRLVWHTTEGYGLPTYSGSAPHFTIDPEKGELYQHVPITSGAYALVNASGGVETNRAHAIQVEIIAFAAKTQDLSDEAYRNLAALARWIEKHAGVKRKSTVRFAGISSFRRLSGSEWYALEGHCGHQHVPENEHWDPGELLIGKIL